VRSKKILDKDHYFFLYFFFCTNIFQCKIQGVHYTRSPTNWQNSDSLIILIVLHTVALLVIICTTFFYPNSIITSLMCLTIKSLSFISLDPSIDFKNIGPLSLIAMKLIRGLPWGSLHPTLTIVTPLCFHEFLIGRRRFSTWLLSLSSRGLLNLFYNGGC